jgi:Domain of unknown function (DUF4386)
MSGLRTHSEARYLRMGKSLLLTPLFAANATSYTGMMMEMNSQRTDATIVGMLFIVAAVTAIIGFFLYGPILNNADYLITGAGHGNQIVLGALFELLLACSAIGTAIMLYPYLRKFNESIALGYVCFRFLEAVLIVVGVLSMLSLLTLSREFVQTVAPNIASFRAAGAVLLAIHDWTFLLGPAFMLGINTTMCSYLLYRSRLVPRFISIAGLTGAALVFSQALLGMFGITGQLSWGAVLALPVFVYEMSLAIWLIGKGFNVSAIVPESAKTA